MNRAAAALLAVALLAGCGAGSSAGPVGRQHATPRASGALIYVRPEQPRSHEPTTSRTPVVPIHSPEPPPRATDAKLIAPYAWADSGHDPIANAATLSLVKGIGPRAALRILDPHPATPVATPQDVDHWIGRHPGGGSHYNQAIYAGHRDGWTFVLEDNGFNATAAADELSRHGAAVVIYSNVDALCSFQYAVGGRVVREFDPLIFNKDERRNPLPQERGIRFGYRDYRYLARSMLLAHRLTGLQLTPADVQPGRYDVAVATRY